MNKRLLIVFLLGFSSGLPLALITSTLQAWFADSGMSILATGMLSLVGLPYLYRIFWAPALDRYNLSSLGKRRSWILITQIGLFVGFNAMAWFTPTQTPGVLALMAFILAFFSATQDTAIDAHRTDYLPLKEQAIGASLAVLGYRLALLIAGGLALIVAQHFGWAATYRLMGALMFVGILAIIISPEPSIITDTKISLLSSFLDPIKDLFYQKNSIALLCFILFYKLGEAFTATTSGIVMPFLIQGIGFSLDTIGYINKLLGISSILLGGVVAGLLLMRWSLYRALMVFGILQAFTNLSFVALAMAGKNITVLAIAVVSDNFAAGMGSTALVALFMKIVNKQFTATQFALLVTLSTVPRVLSGPIAACLQMQLGWVGLYQLSFFLALGFIPFLMRIKEWVSIKPTACLNQ